MKVAASYSSTRLWGESNGGGFRGTQWWPVAATLAFSGCKSQRSTLDSVSQQAGSVETLWWIFFAVCAAVYLAVIVVVLVVALRPGTENSVSESENRSPDDRRNLRSVSVAVGLSTLILIGLLFADFFTHRALPALNSADALVIKVTGHQWWWQAEYQDPVPSNLITTSNEIHLPVGRPVQFLLQSADVIHSFWLPNLHGKKDLVPGHPTTLWFQPDRVGTFTGQCAEFCGLQHAHMSLVAVVEETPEVFARWQEAQRKSANAPADDHQRQGEQIFLTRSCVLCHTIAGTSAGSRVGPQLTHFGSQQTFASGSFENTRENVIAWVRDPQAMKPGVRMPATPLSADDLEAVVDYVRNLK